MNVHIDPDAGFCYGVNRAIGMAEKELDESAEIYSLGQIVHNDEEEQRLKHLGMKTITRSELETAHMANRLQPMILQKKTKCI